MVLDVIFILLCVLLFIRGWKKGLIYAVLSLVALLIGMLAAVKFSDFAAVYLDLWLDISSRYIPLIAFIAVFFAVYFLFRFVAKALEETFKALKVNFLNQLAGGLVFLVIWAMLFSTILFYGNNMKIFSEELKAESVCYEKLAPFAPQVTALIGKVIPFVKDIYNDLQEWFDELDNRQEKHPVVEVQKMGE